ncbi:MAG: hypothetical protein COT89_01915 [Candidatus Colwellbacteria bacterium CG10_big_fil_rev_8_21_14_0_10_42_22]|uniref:Uncharacterized protein n=1 Tax=Candidatus Colwellbacteria bacterium CG10_big_fil_rev_8_21_14_0_10_42_22 TaxID=1974540 RepID=A0A2H0VFX1_9BACT|nr:MAG: hypothetical protein COT89_01915 [Candidatus Colwellbacteria bacterium CG10_big_fil_rev_8_21_14_0_10_42_22]
MRFFGKSEKNNEESSDETTPLWDAPIPSRKEQIVFQIGDIINKATREAKRVGALEANDYTGQRTAVEQVDDTFYQVLDRIVEAIDIGAIDDSTSYEKGKKSTGFLVDTVLRSLAGEDSPRSYSIRRHLLSRAGRFAIAESLVSLDSEASWRFREEMIESGIPSHIVLASLAGLSSSATEKLRREYIDQRGGLEGLSREELYSLGKSLAGVQTNYSFEIRRYLKESGESSALVESLLGVHKSDEADEFRLSLRDRDLFRFPPSPSFGGAYNGVDQGLEYSLLGVKEESDVRPSLRGSIGAPKLRRATTGLIPYWWPDNDSISEKAWEERKGWAPAGQLDPANLGRLLIAFHGGPVRIITSRSGLRGFALESDEVITPPPLFEKIQ